MRYRTMAAEKKNKPGLEHNQKTKADSHVQESTSAEFQKEWMAVQAGPGNRYIQRMVDSARQGSAVLPIQAKLTVGSADDAYEQEADRVAAQVMSMPDPTPKVQRTREEYEEEEIQAKPLAATITPLVQRAATLGDSFEPGLDFESRLAASRGGGRPLPTPTREFMEQRFGADFGGVRVLTSSDAAQLNCAIAARAFTLGQDIFWGSENHDPDSTLGKRLLAHELAHIVQQSGSQLSARKERNDAPDLHRGKPDLIQRDGEDGSANVPVPPRFESIVHAEVPKAGRDSQAYGPAGDTTEGRITDLVSCPDTIAKGSGWWQLFNLLVAHGEKGRNALAAIWAKLLQADGDKARIPSGTALEHGTIVGAAGVLAELWDDTYKIGTTATAEAVVDRVEGRLSADAKAARIVAPRRVGDKHVFAFRGEGRDPLTVMRHGGALPKCEVMAAEHNYDKPWHPVNNGAKNIPRCGSGAENMLSRPAKSDAEETSTISVTSDLITATVFPHVDDLVASEKIQTTYGSEEVVTDIWVYLCAIPSGSSAMDPLGQAGVIQQAVFVGGEWQVRRIPDQHIWGSWAVRRTHKSRHWADGHTAKVRGFTWNVDNYLTQVRGDDYEAVIEWAAGLTGASFVFDAIAR